MAVSIPIVPNAAKNLPPDKPKPFCGQFRGARRDVIEKVKAARLTDAQKAVLLEEIANMPAEHDLLDVHWHRHPHRAGANGTWTVTEL